MKRTIPSMACQSSRIGDEKGSVEWAGRSWSAITVLPAETAIQRQKNALHSKADIAAVLAGRSKPSCHFAKARIQYYFNGGIGAIPNSLIFRRFLAMTSLCISDAPSIDGSGPGITIGALH